MMRLATKEANMPPVISLSPNPPTETQEMTVTVTGGTPPFTVYFDWDPPGTPTSADTDVNGKVTITVPAGATSVSVSSVNATPVSTTVTPLSI
jgi:prolyl-tRNA editing enzyme YbaK/EbsC (Cys-tRNA(Pro) deacylase)